MDENYDEEGDLDLVAFYIAPKTRAFGGAKDHAYHSFFLNHVKKVISGWVRDVDIACQAG